MSALTTVTVAAFWSLVGTATVNFVITSVMTRTDSMPPGTGCNTVKSTASTSNGRVASRVSCLKLPNIFLTVGCVFCCHISKMVLKVKCFLYPGTAVTLIGRSSTGCGPYREQVQEQHQFGLS